MKLSQDTCNQVSKATVKRSAQTNQVNGATGAFAAIIGTFIPNAGASEDAMPDTVTACSSDMLIFIDKRERARACVSVLAHACVSVLAHACVSARVHACVSVGVGRGGAHTAIKLLCFVSTVS